jgi:hypothetical protein
LILTLNFLILFTLETRKEMSRIEESS